MNKHNPNNIEKILADIFIHLDPDLLIKSYRDQVDDTKIDKKKLNKYSSLLNDINYFYKKILRYEIYFDKFYPESNEIENFEALECHIYSYMEILDIFRNKIVAFFGLLKNDLKQIFVNKKEINIALGQFIDNVEGMFDGVKKHRHPHHHNGHRLLNSNIINANFFSMMLNNNFPLENLNIAEIEKRKNESFEKAKQDYINLSARNSKQMSSFVNEIFEMHKDSIYKVLNIKHLAFKEE